MSKEQIRQTAENYLEGDTKGNMKQSMLKADYSESYSTHRGDDMWKNVDFQAELADRRAEIEAGDDKRIEVLDKQWNELYQASIGANDRTNTARVLENKSKHEGYYGRDHEQANEARQLSDKREEAAKWAAKLLNENPWLGLHKPAG